MPIAIFDRPDSCYQGLAIASHAMPCRQSKGSQQGLLLGFQQGLEGLVLLLLQAQSDSRYLLAVSFAESEALS